MSKSGMKLYNKGQRSFIILSKNVIGKGEFAGRKCADGTNQDKVWFDKDTMLDVTTEQGSALLKLYPKEIRKMLDLESSPKAAKKQKVNVEA